MTKEIRMYDAIRWIATMAAADGVVTPSERKVIRDFASAYDINPGIIYRLAYAIAKNVEIPEVEFVSHTKMLGKKFEEFVVSLCSDKSRFKLLFWRGDKISGKTYALETLLPDLHVCLFLESGKEECLIECKYRSAWCDGVIDLSNRFDRYCRASLDYDRELFFAIGIGGKASSPEELFIVPSKMIETDRRIDRERFISCLCQKDPASFHDFFQRYYS